MIPFESENSKAYTLLLRIEITLREQLKVTFKATYGERWQKQLPGELLTKIRKAQTEEVKPQFDFIRLGPLYYLTFGELLAILQQKTGRSVADMFGGDIFLKQLENLFAPRNAICHSRPVSSNGLQAIQTVYSQMETALTKDMLEKLVAHPDIGVTQKEFAKTMLESLEAYFDEISNLSVELHIPEIYRRGLSQYWWANDSLSGFNRSTIESAIALVQDYNKLPKGVGSAGNRHKFCDKMQLLSKIQTAIDELRKATT